VIKIILIRHGATPGNLKRKYIGRTDEPLCREGIEQIKALRKDGLKADRLFVSPMLRARQTAEILFPDMTADRLDGIAEMDFGIFEGKSADELSESLEYRSWVDSGCLDPIPDGERFDSFKHRCCAAFEGAVRGLSDGQCAAFVTHGGVIMALLEAFAKPKRPFYNWHVENGGWVECVCGDGQMTIARMKTEPHNE